MEQSFWVKCRNTDTLFHGCNELRVMVSTYTYF